MAWMRWIIWEKIGRECVFREDFFFVRFFMSFGRSFCPTQQANGWMHFETPERRRFVHNADDDNDFWSIGMQFGSFGISFRSPACNEPSQTDLKQSCDSSGSPVGPLAITRHSNEQCQWNGFFNSTNSLFSSHFRFEPTFTSGWDYCLKVSRCGAAEVREDYRLQLSHSDSLSPSSIVARSISFNDCENRVIHSGMVGAVDEIRPTHQKYRWIWNTDTLLHFITKWMIFCYCDKRRCDDIYIYLQTRDFWFRTINIQIEFPYGTRLSMGRGGWTHRAPTDASICLS